MISFYFSIESAYFATDVGEYWILRVVDDSPQLKYFCSVYLMSFEDSKYSFRSKKRFASALNLITSIIFRYFESIVASVQFVK